ncbi:MAG: hypothetical protein M3Q30_15700 [Actinomycetota bacterium]|nr:hypothetical protein [Actinomycetota bacterium]MDP9334733.1 hypothetical protein [Actinomycetota bacterium]
MASNFGIVVEYVAVGAIRKRCVPRSAQALASVFTSLATRDNLSGLCRHAVTTRVAAADACAGVAGLSTASG